MKIIQVIPNEATIYLYGLGDDGELYRTIPTILSPKWELVNITYPDVKKTTGNNESIKPCSNCNRTLSIDKTFCAEGEIINDFHNNYGANGFIRSTQAPKNSLSAYVVLVKKDVMLCRCHACSNTWYENPPE